MPGVYILENGGVTFAVRPHGASGIVVRSVHVGGALGRVLAAVAPVLRAGFLNPSVDETGASTLVELSSQSRQGNRPETMGEVGHQQRDLMLLETVNQAPEQVGRVPQSMHQNQGSGVVHTVQWRWRSTATVPPNPGMGATTAACKRPHHRPRKKGHSSTLHKQHTARLIAQSAS